jgi:hypothetical protein
MSSPEVNTIYVQNSEPEELNKRLQSCGLTLFGDSPATNDCVWSTIAHLLGISVNELKRRTGLSPTPGVAGIHAVEGLLTSLGRRFL